MCELVISNFFGVSLGGVTFRTVGGMGLMGCGWVVFWGAGDLFYGVGGSSMKSMWQVTS